jgi:hypothetical protein
LIREDGPPAILFENDIAATLIVPKAYWSIVTGPPASCLRTAAELLDSRKNSPNRGLASHQNPMPDYCITLPTT